jgi:hypothetical protein
MNFTKQIDSQKDKSFKIYNSCSVRQGHDSDFVFFYYNKLNSVRGNKDKDDGIDGS